MQDYKLVVRNLGGGKTVFDSAGNIEIQNFSEFMNFLNENYLEQGYTVLSADLVGKIPANLDLGTSPTYEFAYHLVKEVSSVPHPQKPIATNKA